MILLPDYNDKYNKVDRTKTTLLSLSYFFSRKNKKNIINYRTFKLIVVSSTYFIIQYYIIILLPDYNDKYNKVDGTKTTLLSFSYFFSGKKTKKISLNTKHSGSYSPNST